MKVFSLSLLFVFTLSLSYGQSPGSGKALNLSNTIKYVEVANSTSMNITAAITIEAWINASAFGTEQWNNSIVSKDEWSSGSNGFALRCGNGKLSFNIGTTSQWIEVASASLMSTNEWYHVVSTFDGFALKIYINGELVGTTNYTGSMNASTFPIRIGESTYSAVSSRPFSGKMDEIRIWNVALD